MKVHVHSEQFDGHPHPWCGRGETAVPEDVFARTPYKMRCKVCDRDQFPYGQPQWHFEFSVSRSLPPTPGSCS
jgi:hypothetical protein